MPMLIDLYAQQVVNTHDENIRQSGSFNRLMYSVIGATDY